MMKKYTRQLSHCDIEQDQFEIELPLTSTLFCFPYVAVERLLPQLVTMDDPLAKATQDHKIAIRKVPGQVAPLGR